MNRPEFPKVAALACDQLSEEGPLKTVFRSSSFLEVRQKFAN